MAKRMGVVAVFLAGCAVGGASSQFVVPKATAQQAATLTRWEYYCMHLDPTEMTAPANRLGMEGWEMVGISTYPSNVATCFKRPRM